MSGGISYDSFNQGYVSRTRTSLSGMGYIVLVREELDDDLYAKCYDAALGDLGFLFAANEENVRANVLNRSYSGYTAATQFDSLVTFDSAAFCGTWRIPWARGGGFLQPLEDGDSDHGCALNPRRPKMSVPKRHDFPTTLPFEAERGH
jgi:hypothetical protein